MNLFDCLPEMSLTAGSISMQPDSRTGRKVMHSVWSFYVTKWTIDVLKRTYIRKIVLFLPLLYNKSDI